MEMLEDLDVSTHVWESLTPEQKRYFKELAEKSEDNMRYIG